MSNRFLILWTGQLMSLLGSSLTGFGISLWVYETTQSSMMMSLAVFCKILPAIYVSLFAGRAVDSWPLRRTFIVTDLALMATTLVLALAYSKGDLHLPFLLGALVLTGAIESVQS